MQEVRQLRTTEVQSSLIKGNSTTRDYFTPWYLHGGFDKTAENQMINLMRRANLLRKLERYEEKYKDLTVVMGALGNHLEKCWVYQATR